MVDEKKNLIQFLLEKTANKAADSASIFCLYEPKLPETLKEEKEKK